MNGLTLSVRGAQWHFVVAQPARRFDFGGDRCVVGWLDEWGRIMVKKPAHGYVAVPTSHLL